MYSPHSFSRSFMCLFSSFHPTFPSVFVLLKFSFQTKSLILFLSAGLQRAGRCSHCSSAWTILLLGFIFQQNRICSYERRLLWSCFSKAASVCASFHQLLWHPVSWMQSYSKAVSLQGFLVLCNAIKGLVIVDHFERPKHDAVSGLFQKNALLSLSHCFSTPRDL